MERIEVNINHIVCWYLVPDQTCNKRNKTKQRGHIPNQNNLILVKKINKKCMGAFDIIPYWLMRDLIKFQHSNQSRTRVVGIKHKLHYGLPKESDIRGMCPRDEVK